jgi:tetratricopeptide (TPR) repeat protein
MRCRKAEKLISESLENLLSNGQEAALRSHLETCSRCRELALDFEVIIREAKRLPHPEPTPFAWRKISAAVRERGRPAGSLAAGKKVWRPGMFQTSKSRFALAAALALVIVGGVIVIEFRSRQVEPSLQEGSVEFTVAKLEEAQRYYEKAIQALSDAVQSQQNGLNPLLAEVFKDNLKALDASIQACRQMIEKDPNNLAARSYLLTAYREKVSFLEQMVAVERASAWGEPEIIL